MESHYGIWTYFNLFREAADQTKGCKKIYFVQLLI